MNGGRDESNMMREGQPQDSAGMMPKMYQELRKPPPDLGPFDAYKQMVDQRTADIGNVLEALGNRLARFSYHHPAEPSPKNETKPDYETDFKAMHKEHQDRLDKLFEQAQYILDGFNL